MTAILQARLGAKQMIGWPGDGVRRSRRDDLIAARASVGLIPTANRPHLPRTAVITRFAPRPAPSDGIDVERDVLPLPLSALLGHWSRLQLLTCGSGSRGTIRRRQSFETRHEPDQEASQQRPRNKRQGLPPRKSPGDGDDGAKDAPSTVATSRWARRVTVSRSTRSVTKANGVPMTSATRRRGNEPAEPSAEKIGIRRNDGKDEEQHPGAPTTQVTHEEGFPGHKRLGLRDSLEQLGAFRIAHLARSGTGSGIRRSPHRSPGVSHLAQRASRRTSSHQSCAAIRTAAIPRHRPRASRHSRGSERRCPGPSQECVPAGRWPALRASPALGRCVGRG